MHIKVNGITVDLISDNFKGFNIVQQLNFEDLVEGFSIIIFDDILAIGGWS